MSKYQVVLIALTVACIAVANAKPPCAKNDEVCKDLRMHPDLPDVDPIHKRVLIGEDTSDYWIEKGKAHVREKLNYRENKQRAKNIIMFLGDGMGLTTVASARNLLGGEEKCLSFESFPYTGLSKTYSVDKIVPDSACTATAYLCGVKAQEGTIGVTGNVAREDCVAMQDENNHVFSIAKWAMDSGKSAGVVTTTRITHASPAGVYAHIADRDWENDAELKAVCGEDTTAKDIAYQLINGEVGKRLKLMLGGGRKNFASERTDGLDLISMFKEENEKNAYVETLDQLKDVNLDEANRILGLFQDSHLLYHLETNATTNQPTLEEMTRTAIEYLSKNEQGYFIFIEGGRIDLAHHDNMARIALDETIEFSKAIQAAIEMTNDEETLIVVTADHSHSFSYAGYPYRGNDIFGRAPATPDDETPYLTLSYANGPSYDLHYDAENHRRRNPLEVLTGDAHDMFPATLPLELETHGGDDVPVFASGPWAHLFTGVYEQNTIPHMMAFAGCLGSGYKSCDDLELLKKTRK